MKTEKKHIALRFGYSTLILLYTMICIIIFEFLTFVTANSDYKLSEKSTNKNTAYHDAMSYASKNLEEIDTLLLDCYKNSTSPSEYFEKASLSLTGLQGTLEKEGETLYYIYDVVINSINKFQVKLEITYPVNNEDGFYKLLNWNVTSQS